MRNMIAAALAVRGRCAQRLALEIEIEQAALAQAVADRRPLANHYWQARHQAEQRLRASLAVLDALTED